MRTRTKIYIIVGIVLVILLIAPLVYLYLQYGEWGIYGGLVGYAVIVAFIIGIYNEIKHPRPRRYREPYYENRVNVYHHYEDDRRPPTRKPYQQDDRLSPMYQKRAEKFSAHKWDVADNYGYFNKKKRKK